MFIVFKCEKKLIVKLWPEKALQKVETWVEILEKIVEFLFLFCLTFYISTNWLQN